MYGTVIQDAYTKEEAIEIIDAIEDICTPTDFTGWSLVVEREHLFLIV